MLERACEIRAPRTTCRISNAQAQPRLQRSKRDLPIRQFLVLQKPNMWTIARTWSWAEKWVKLKALWFKLWKPSQYRTEAVS